MLCHWCMRALVAFPPRGPTTIVQTSRVALLSLRRFAGACSCLNSSGFGVLDKDASSHLHLFGIGRFLTG
jgi:hypothetical protein